MHDTCEPPVSPFVGVSAQIKPTVHKTITQIHLESNLSFSHRQKYKAESFSEVHTLYQRCENSRGEKILFPPDFWICSSRPLGEQLACGGGTHTLECLWHRGLFQLMFS